MRWVAVLAVLGLGLGGCSLSLDAVAVDGRTPQFTECRPPFVFAGEASLDQLGLGDIVGPPDAGRAGMVWVTRDPVSPDQFGPPGGGALGGPPPGQQVCVEWRDGSGMSTTLSERWEPEPAAAPVSEDAEAPIALLGLLVAVAVVVAVSWVAFRGDARRAA